MHLVLLPMLYVAPFFLLIITARRWKDAWAPWARAAGWGYAGLNGPLLILVLSGKSPVAPVWVFFVADAALIIWCVLWLAHHFAAMRRGVR